MLEQRMARGEKVPALENEPEISDDLVVYWEAWRELQATKQVGLGAQHITFTELAAWLDFKGVTDPEERQQFAFFVMGLDNAWVAWAREEADSRAKRQRQQAESQGRARRSPRR